MIAALLKKDLRVNRVPMLGNLILVLAAYGVVVVVGLSDRRTLDAYDWTQLFTGASIAGAWLTFLLISVYAGVAFAQERRERSADFLAMLPVSRRQVVLSKFIVAWAIPMIFFLCLVSVFLVCNSITTSWIENRGRDLLMHPPIAWRPPWDDVVRSLVLSGSLACMLFGVAWLFSIKLESPALAASISIASTILINVTLALIAENIIRYKIDSGGLTLEQASRTDFAILICCVASLLIGLTCFIYGTINYLRRVEP